MGHGPDQNAAGAPPARRLFVYNGGFLTQKRVKRILALSGFEVRVGLPGPEDLVGVWGNSPTSHRGEAIAAHRGTGTLRVEDAWLRSLFPGRKGEAPIGLTLDETGVHYDAGAPSDLERLLATHPLDDTALLDRARGGIARMIEAHVTKYSAVATDAALPPPGYVLVIDQTRDDASVVGSGADRNRFLEMLFVAREEHPGKPILIKSHPETAHGLREGYFTPGDLSDNMAMLTENVSPWSLFEGAVAVYTVSSQMGFEAIFAGHKPRLFGQPFYAGWDLTADEFPVQRRQRRLTRAQLFAAAMLLYPKWYDPYRDGLCSFEEALETLAAQARCWREDHRGWVASGMRMWKRKPLQDVFGRYKPVLFEEDPDKVRASKRPAMVWAGKAGIGHRDAVRVEDGFLRSRGLGAELVPPLSLVLDDLGIYYDPSSPSRLEQLIAKRATLRPDQDRRAQALIRDIRALRLSKYNLGGAGPDLPQGKRVLVVGQVEDDASLVTGGGAVRTNADLLRATRKARPDAVLVYKPHPDVEAGLRPGGSEVHGIADVIAAASDPSALLSQIDELWTMTSLMGFEALIREIPVTTLGAPFYAGWGLTQDLGDVPPRRRANPTLAGLVHAALIDYPRYFDPVTGLPCPVEIALLRLSSGSVAGRSLGNRLLSKLQGLLASHAHRWR